MKMEFGWLAYTVSVHTHTLTPRATNRQNEDLLHSEGSFPSASTAESPSPNQQSLDQSPRVPIKPALPFAPSSSPSNLRTIKVLKRS